MKRIYNKFAVPEPSFFQITIPFRNNVLQQLPAQFADEELAMKASSENLRYIIRITLTNHLFYTPVSKESTAQELMTLAKRNVSRLFRQLDHFRQLPQQQSGFLIGSFRFTIMPFVPDSETVKKATDEQVDEILQIVANTVSSFTLFIGRFGPTASISLPVICIGLSTLSSSSATRLMRHIYRFVSPFDTELHPTRFSVGQSIPTGQVWNYARVPLGCSISSNHMDNVIPEGTAGTLGVYVYEKTDLITRYALTTGHVAPSGEAADSISAPASKPYLEALKSMQAGIAQREKKGNLEGKREYEEKLNALRDLDRSFGSVIYSTTRTSTVAPFPKEDVALLKVKPNRAANNSLEHGPGYADYIWNTTDASYPGSTIVPQLGVKVMKFGIRTGYTEGLIVQPTYVRWEPDETLSYDPDDPAYSTVPASLCYTIMSTSTPFANCNMTAIRKRIRSFLHLFVVVARISRV